jgi:hypothetical protein
MKTPLASIPQTSWTENGCNNRKLRSRKWDSLFLRIFRSLVIACAIYGSNLAQATPPDTTPDTHPATALTEHRDTALTEHRGIAQWFDRSHSIFLPKQLSTQLGAHQTFPIFWWNFIILEYDTEDLGQKQASSLCQQFSHSEFIQKSACSADLSQFKPILNDWARDITVRIQAPSVQAITEKLNAALAKASLPLGPQGRSLLEVLRVDPLESYRELQQQVEKKMKLKLEKSHGLFIDRELRRIVIPIQFNFPPNIADHTAKFREQLKSTCDKEQFCKKITHIGPHASALDNEQQINADLDIVSIVGTLLLILLAAGAVLSKRPKLLLLVPPVFVSTAVAIVLTIGIFGSIHGLTLSFGTGIIGLAIDYGLHSIFNRKYRGIWKANWYGLLTTLAALVLMACSSIPLLRQIMIFSILGITLGYFVFYVLHKKFPKTFDVKPYPIHHKPSLFKLGSVCVLLACAVLGIFRLNLNLDLRQFDFQAAKTRELSTWFYKSMKMKPPLLQIYNATSDQSALNLAYEQRQWANQNQIELENLSNYLPSEAIQLENIQSWKAFSCAQHHSKTKVHFSQLHQDLQPVLLQTKDEILPAYLKDFWGNGRWISLWFPKDDQEVQTIRSKYPDCLSLLEIVSVFPKTLSKELSWMAPLSVVLASILLGLYYRRIKLTLCGLIPFLSGLGLFALAAMVFHFNMTFITIIALVIVFGVSIDYGVFATDLMMGKKRSVTGVWSAMSFSALVAIVGFIPLIFCTHPVLKQLGEPLVFGTIGTFLGTYWGIPGFFKFFRMYDLKND